MTVKPQRRQPDPLLPWLVLLGICWLLLVVAMAVALVAVG